MMKYLNRLTKLMLTLLAIQIVLGEEVTNEPISTTTTTTTTATASASASALPEATTTSTTGTMQQECACTAMMEEFENLQSNLDNCLSQETQHVQSLTSCRLNQQDIVQSMSDIKTKLQNKMTQNEINCKTQISALETKIITNEQNMQNQKEEQNSNFKMQIENLKLQLHETNVSNDELLHQKLQIQLTNTTNELKTECQINLSNQESFYNETLSTTKSHYESKYTTLEQKYNTKTKELRAQIASIQQQLTQQTKSHDAIRDKYHDAREDVTQLQRDLRQMHHQAQNSYFNVTLMKEDFVFYSLKKLDGIVFWVGEQHHHLLRLMDQDDKMIQQYGWYQEGKRWIKAHVIPPMTKLYHGYILPQMNHAGVKLCSVDAIEGFRLLTVSIMEKGSTIALNYIELTTTTPNNSNNKHDNDNDMRDWKRKQKMKHAALRDSQQHHHHHHRRYNSRAIRKLRDNSKKLLLYTQKNAESMLHSVLRWIVLYIVMVRIIIFGFGKVFLWMMMRLFFKKSIVVAATSTAGGN